MNDIDKYTDYAAINDIDGYIDYTAITTLIDTELYKER